MAERPEDPTLGSIIFPVFGTASADSGWQREAVGCLQQAPVIARIGAVRPGHRNRFAQPVAKSSAG